MYEHSLRPLDCSLYCQKLNLHFKHSAVGKLKQMIEIPAFLVESMNLESIEKYSFAMDTYHTHGEYNTYCQQLQVLDS